MSPKPFIAARIPENINERLAEYTKTTGETRTQALVNALAAYLGCTPESEEKGGTSDRITVLEKKFAELERLVKTPMQTELFDNDDVIKTDKKSEAKQTKKESKEKEKRSDNKTDNNVDNKTDEKTSRLLSHKEISAMTGMKFETVRSRHRKNTSIDHQGKFFVPTRDGKTPKWKEADN